MNEKQFIETYCHKCGTQRCEGIGTEWFEGCPKRWNLDGQDPATEIQRLNDKIYELGTKILNTQKDFIDGLSKLDPYIVDGTVMFELGSYIEFLKQMGAQTGDALNKHYQIGTKSRCHKCIHELVCAKNSDNEGKCKSYKRDPKDGGFYG